MYAALLSWLVALWISKELSPTTRIPTAAVVVGPIVVALMVASIRYLRSEAGTRALALYSAMDLKMKVLLGTVSLTIYGAIFLRLAELGARYSQFTHRV
jgi:hypothetical protein